MDMLERNLAEEKKERDRLRKQAKRLQDKLQNEAKFNKKRADEKQAERNNKREIDLEQFKKKRAEEKRKERNVQKEQNLEQFKKKRAEEKRKERDVEKEQNLEQFKKKRAEEKRKERNKKRAAEKRKERDVEKEQDLEQFKKKRAEEKRKERDVEKEQDLEQFKKKRAEERRKERNRKRDLDLATFQQTEATERQERRKTAKVVDVTKFNLKRAAAMKSWRLKQDKLPRTLNEAGLVVVQLKRKLEYRSHHKEQYVDVKKIFSAIKTMKSMGNRFYQFIPDDVEFKTRCQETDPEGYCLLFGDGKDQGDVVQSTTTECSEENKHTDDEEESNEEQEYIEKDPIRRNQFNYNRSTCFADNLPEIRVENNTRNVINTVEVAPGENKVPTNIFQEKHYEEKSFPGHFPNGKNGKDEERPVKLRDQDYFTQRIMNEDERCAKDPAYIFAAAAFVESKQIARNINLSFQRGKKTHLPDGKCVYSLDDGYMVLDNIKNTPRYWQKI
ncbi:RNA-binding protein 25-like [Dendronephthya gigantea]|uniref:RNA-binding protein 25-like n=1 Tax=Dendronephthya gigantea TaxID=151771 RepID=UPI00106D8490|nr:RNA-binding protein 25-like [Dendronephthya gigantea]